ncbi:hypothetical protein L3X38_030547 [Prunus dulcis]|uniref:Uncharacterized protein n=1 Tax=Prunus dulcis TaxID=3755 RepID=A0AAD4VBN5_PRUDU|nr:hypothetical protein L3X38_030547 [Prunus dulcis]
MKTKSEETFCRDGFNEGAPVKESHKGRQRSYQNIKNLTNLTDHRGEGGREGESGSRKGGSVGVRLMSRKVGGGSVGRVGEDDWGRETRENIWTNVFGDHSNSKSEIVKIPKPIDGLVAISWEICNRQ